VSRKLWALLIWLSGVSIIASIQWQYHPTDQLAITASLMLAGFAVLLSWSAGRLGVRELSGVLKLVVISFVAGLMASQGLDVIYQQALAPAGGRLDLPFEVAAFALQLFPVAYLIARVWPRPWPKPEVEANPTDGQSQPE